MHPFLVTTYLSVANIVTFEADDLMKVPAFRILPPMSTLGLAAIIFILIFSNKGITPQQGLFRFGTIRHAELVCVVAVT